MTRSYLLDASALLALIFNEPGADRVAALLDDSLIHALNLAEVARKLVSIGKPVEEVMDRLQELDLEVVAELSGPQIRAVAAMTDEASRLGLSLGDCVCLAVAGALDKTAVTAERRWSEVQGTAARVLQIR